MTMPTEPRSLRRGLPALLGAAAILAACATPSTPNSAALPRHVAPVGGPTAKLVMRGTVPQGDVYAVYLSDDAVACQGQRIVGAGNPTRVPTSTTIAAERLQTVDFRLFRADKRTCLVRWSFTPVAGRSYLIAGAATPTGCSARMLDATDPDAIKPVQGALIRTSTTQACVGINDARALPGPGPAGGQGASGEAVLVPGATAADLDGLVKP